MFQTQDAAQGGWRPLITWLRILFGVHLAYSGFAFILDGWVPTAFGQAQSASGQFMVALDQIGLYPFVKYLEAVVGLMLIFNVAVPLALVLEMPITVVISYLNLIVEAKSRHLYTGTQELLLNVTLLLAYGGYYRTMLFTKAAPLWLWHSAPAAPSAQKPLPAHNNTVALWTVVIALSLIIMAASWILGPPDRKLPPRDYVPLIIATAVMLWDMRRAKA